MAADEVVAVDRGDPTNHRNRLKEQFPRGFDYVVDATGTSIMCEEALLFVGSGGTLLIYSVCPPNETIVVSPFDIFRRELTIKGTFAQISSFPRALSYLESGKLRVGGIVSHAIPLADFGRTLALARSRQAIKIAVIP